MKPADRADLGLTVVLAASAAAAVFVGSRLLDPFVLHPSTWDFWFESDPPGVVGQLFDRFGRDHDRTTHHPLFSLTLFPLAGLLNAVLGSESLAVATLLAMTAALTTAMLFLTLRRMALTRVEATAVTALAAVLASNVFWFTVPESFSFGACTIVCAVFLVARADAGEAVSWPVALGVSLLTLAMTSTNWMVGLAMLVALMPASRAIVMALATMGLALPLWWLQKAMFPLAGFPWRLSTPKQTDYLFNPESHGLLAKATVFLYHSVVAPDVGYAYGYRLTVQDRWPGQGSTLAFVAVAVWTALLVFTVFRWRDVLASKVGRMLVIILAGQLALALAFGVETFMYSAHWATLLVLLVAAGMGSTRRRMALVAVVVLCVAAGINNVTAFRLAAGAVERRYADERQFSAAVLAATDPSGAIVCGRHPHAAVGEPPNRFQPSDPLPPVREISLVNYTDPCFFAFDANAAGRQGWMLPYENWSIENIEAHRRAGARYFVTPYVTGIASQPDMFRELDRRYRRLSASERWRIYELTDVGAPGSDPRRTQRQ